MLRGVLLDSVMRRSGAWEEGSRTARARFERAMFGAVGVAGAVLVFLVGRDLSWNEGTVPGQIRLLHLFTYNYRRPWPVSLNFTPWLWGFTAAAAGMTGLLAWARVRRHVVVVLVVIGVLFGGWGLDVYFMKTSPHWGQRETVMAYWEANREVPGQLVAYQMNWKGENFYMGNHVPAFVSSGKRFQDWMAEQRQRGQKTFYFLTEHSRTGSLQNELKGPRGFERLTTPELNNKFILVRASF